MLEKLKKIFKGVAKPDPKLAELKLREEPPKEQIPGKPKPEDK